jgi:hypothetical protein
MRGPTDITLSFSFVGHVSCHLNMRSEKELSSHLFIFLSSSTILITLACFLREAKFEDGRCYIRIHIYSYLFYGLFYHSFAYSDEGKSRRHSLGISSVLAEIGTQCLP